MADNQHFQYMNKLSYFKEIYGKSKASKLQLKSLFLPPQRTLDLEYQDGGDELQNLITEITEMLDLGLFISVTRTYYLPKAQFQSSGACIEMPLLCVNFHIMDYNCSYELLTI